MFVENVKYYYIKDSAFKMYLIFIFVLFFSLFFHTLNRKTWTQWTGMELR